MRPATETCNRCFPTQAVEGWRSCARGASAISGGLAEKPQALAWRGIATARSAGSWMPSRFCTAVLSRLAKQKQAALAEQVGRVGVVVMGSRSTCFWLRSLSPGPPHNEGRHCPAERLPLQCSHQRTREGTKYLDGAETQHAGHVCVIGEKLSPMTPGQQLACCFGDVAWIF